MSYVLPDRFFVNDLGLVDAGTGSMIRITMNISDSFSAPSVSADGTRVVLTATRTLREVWRCRSVRTPRRTAAPRRD